MDLKNVDIAETVRYFDMDTKTEKEIVIDEVKSPTANDETVEAAKQILADVLTKAVDAIKETTLSGAIEQQTDEKKTETKFWTADSNKTLLDEVTTDYIVKCQWEGKTYLIGEGNTFAETIASARSFETEQEALEYIEKYQPGEKQTCVSLPFTNGEVMMRTIKCQLNEIGHGE